LLRLHPFRLGMHMPEAEVPGGSINSGRTVLNR